MIAVVSRDILIVMAVVLSWLLDNPVRIKLVVSKINTVTQIARRAVLADEGFGPASAIYAPRWYELPPHRPWRRCRLHAGLLAHMAGYQDENTTA